MLTCQNLTITHRKDGRVLVRDFSFTPKKGEHVAIIGEEGNGKSTLVRLMHDPALIADYADWEGIVSKGSGADRSATAYLPQEPEAALAGLPVWEYLGTPDADVGRMASLADSLSVDPGVCWSDRAIGTFSGGEQMKIRLLRLLRGSPDVLLLDEPSNDLDLGALVWLEEWIAARPETVIFISHDEVLLENTAECVIHLEQVMRKTEPRWTVSRAGYREYAAERQWRQWGAGRRCPGRRSSTDTEHENEKYPSSPIGFSAVPAVYGTRGRSGQYQYG